MSAASASDMMTPSEVAPERARRACEKCTRTKKKCDKALPKCGRCSRLSTRCCYNFVYAPPTLASTDLSFYHILQQEQPDDASSTMPAFASNFHSSASSLSSSAAWAPSLPVLAPVPPPPPQRSSSPDSASLSVDLELSAQDLLAMISAQGLSWRNVLDLYYERIHHWIGIVHPEYFRAKIAGLGPGEDPADIETALLLLCMYLAVRPAQDGAAETDQFQQPHPGRSTPAPFGVNYPTPDSASYRSSTPPLPTWATSLPTSVSRGSTPPPGCSRAETNHMLSSPLYRTAKRMLVLLRAFCPPNIELVQSGTLLALYELGHGDPWRAYVTFGEAIAMSKLIGIRPGLWSRDISEHEPVEAHEDQMCSLYWALFVLDKMLHFDFAFVACPLQMPLPPPNSLLPAQNHLWSVQEGRRVEFWRRIPYSAPHTKKRLGPFQRAIQAAVIAHRAMLWEETVRLSGPGRSPSTSRATFLDLDAQARNLVEVIIFQEQAFTEDCEALGMCFGVMLMLHATVLGDRFDERPARRDQKTAATGTSSSLLPGFLEEDLPRVMAGINFVVRMVGDSSADANARMESRVGLASVFSPATVYAAYYALRALATVETVVENAEDRFHDIYTCVVSLGRRWMLAGRFLGTIETLTENRVSDGDSFGAYDFSAYFQ